MQDIALDPLQPARLKRRRVAVSAGIERLAGGQGEDRQRGVGHAGAVQCLLQESQRVSLFLSAEMVDLVQHEEKPDHMSPDLGEIRGLRLRDRRIGGDHEHGRVALGQDPQCRVGVMLERRSDAGRVDQDDAIAQNVGRYEAINAGDAAAVHRIALFRDQFVQSALNGRRVGGTKLLGRTVVLIGDADQRRRRPRDECRYRGGRNHRRWQQRRAEQRVDEGALAAFELPQDRQLEPAVTQPLAQFRDGPERGMPLGPRLLQAGATLVERRQKPRSDSAYPVRRYGACLRPLTRHPPASR